MQASNPQPPLPCHNHPKSPSLNRNTRPYTFILQTLLLPCLSAVFPFPPSFPSPDSVLTLPPRSHLGKGMNVVAAPPIHTVKHTTPEYRRSQSLKSSAASNEYFSEYASDAFSHHSDNDASVQSYETPPSRIPSPALQPCADDSEMTLPSRPGAIHPAPLNIRASQNAGGQRTLRMLSNFDEMSPPTPGIDDTPYIRFAIEQLTRDEDVTGRGRHSTNSPDRYINPLASVDELNPATPESWTPTPSPPPPTPPQQPPTPKPQPVRRKPVAQEIMVPIDLSKELREQLGFVPTPLRLYPLATFLLLILLMIAALIFNLVFASGNNGLYDYDGNASPRYFVFKYLPQLLGSFLLLWLFVVQAAIYRCLPYFSMSSGARRNNILQDFRITPTNYLFPDLSFFRWGEPLLGAAFIIFWSTFLTVPLLSCLFQTQWIATDGTARFRWTAVRGVGWTLVALYTLLIASVLFCLIRFRRSQSTMLWDPASIADMLCLFRRSNLASDFEQTEVSPEPGREIPPRVVRMGFWTTSERADVFHAIGEEFAPIKRLSYRPPPVEKSSDALLPTRDKSDLEAQRFSYGSNFARNVHSPFIRYRWVPWFLRDSAVLAWIIAAVLILIAFLTVSFVNRAVQDGFDPLLSSVTGSGGFSPANFLYSFLPCLLGTALFLAWQPIEMYFRAAQPFCNLSRPGGADARHSLLLDYPSQTPAGVVIRALGNGDWRVAYISFIGILAAWIPTLSGGVFTALHFSEPDQVRMVASMPGYIALCVITSIYALSYLAIWPTRKRHLPHSFNTIAGIMSWLYASPLLDDGLIQNVRTKADLIERFSDSQPTSTTGLTGDQGPKEKSRLVRRSRQPIRKVGTRYGFGIFMGRDGKEHLGIDRMQRPGSREMMIYDEHDSFDYSTIARRSGGSQ